MNGIIDHYKKQSKDIDFPNLKDSISNPDWVHKKYTKIDIDSILFDLANTSFWFFRNIDLSKEYLNLITIDDSLNYYESYINLNTGIQNNDFKADTSDKELNLVYSKSQNYFDDDIGTEPNEFFRLYDQRLATWGNGFTDIMISKLLKLLSDKSKLVLIIFS